MRTEASWFVSNDLAFNNSEWFSITIYRGAGERDVARVRQDVSHSEADAVVHKTKKSI